MRIFIFNYIDARAFVPDAPAIAVRIFDPWEDRPEGNSDTPLTQSEHWLAVVKSTFEDLDPRRYELNGHLETADTIRKKNPFLFKARQAEELVASFKGAVDLVGAPQILMVHCNAGLSRSPAVARALCEIFGFTPEWQPTRDTMMLNGHIGNIHVYESLKQAAESLGFTQGGNNA